MTTLSRSQSKSKELHPTSAYPQATIPKRIEDKISNRWNRWQSLVLRYIQSHPGSPSLDDFRQIHHQYCIHLILRYNIAMRNLIRHDIDNPLISQRKRDRLLTEYLDRALQRRTTFLSDDFEAMSTPPPPMEPSCRTIPRIQRPPIERVYNLTGAPFEPGRRPFLPPRKIVIPSVFRKPNWRLNGPYLFSED